MRSGGKREPIEIAIYGCTAAEVVALGGGTTMDRKSPRVRYLMHRKHARHRGVEWKITFPEWWRIWHESGHWDKRGDWNGYVMGRNGDQGPYSADNVSIISRAANGFESAFWQGGKPIKAIMANHQKYAEKRRKLRGPPLPPLPTRKP